MVESSSDVTRPADPPPGEVPHGLLLASVLPALALSLFYEWQARRLSPAGFPLDDAWIHAQFARNIASGLGFSYTGPQWVAGSTAPLWTLVLAAAYRVLPDIVVVAKALGTLLQLATGYLAGRLAWQLTGAQAAAAAAAAAVAAAPIMAWGAMSGMEVPLAAALVMGALTAYAGAGEQPAARPAAVALALVAAGFSVRPENASLLIVLAAHYTVFGASPRGWLRRAALAVVVAAVCVAPTVWLSEATIGRPLPTTFYAKSGPGLVRAVEARDSAMLKRDLLVWGPRAVAEFGRTSQIELGWALWLAPIGLVAIAARGRRRFAVLSLAIVLIVPYSMGALAPQRLKPDNVRYVGHLIVIVAAVTGCAVALVARLARARLFAWVAAVAIAGTVAVRCSARAPEFARSVANINGLHVALAGWVRVHLPSGSVIAANDVGALAYFGEHRLLDIEGLVSPEALAYRGRPDRGMAFIRDHRPDFVVIFDQWYPEIRRHPESFAEIHRQTWADNVVAAGRTLVVYRTPWTRIDAR
jgi:hypothetical protein